ncbi:hypothetical protein LTR17_021147 [Elasticomyces elasticus]|nr:hypothetical protein LTR17_021147 [Elasticomyces elasticus]
MPPPTPPETTTTASSTASDPTCITCGNNTGIERIDGTKLNRLAETLIKHLSSDVHGNWTVKGNRTTVGKDPRLGQLVEVTSLRTELGEFRAVFERYIALHAPKELVETDKPLTMNKNMRALVDKMVEEKLDKETSALRNRVEVLEEAERARKKVEDKSKINGKPQKVVDLPPTARVVKYDDSTLKAGLQKVSDRIDDAVRVQDESATKVSVIKDVVDVLEPAVRALEIKREPSTTAMSIRTLGAPVGVDTTPETQRLPFGIRPPYIFYSRAWNPSMPVSSKSLGNIRERVMHDSTNPHMVVAHNGNGYYVNTTKHFLNDGRLMGDYIWSTRGSLAWLEHADAVRRPDSEVYLWSCYNNLGVKLDDEVTRKWTAEQNLVPDLRLS